MTKIVFCLFLGTLGSHAATFTGLAFHGTDPTGVNIPTAARWNTLGGGTPIPNIYLFDSSGNPLNSGDGAAARISVPLSPGTYDFSWCLQPWAIGQASFFGVDLFFDGQDSQPLLSAVVPQNSLNTPAPNPRPTFALDGVTPTAGANTTSAIAGNLRIQLLYVFVNDTPGIVDKVALYNNVPDGQPDCGSDIIGLRLTVSEVPEPATSALVFGGVFTLAAMRVVRRRACSYELRQRQSYRAT